MLYEVITYFTRHFKEPTPCVSDSMTEDAAVFGGLVNMKDGLKNCAALYKPEMIAVSTTCMAEVIGDDLYAFAVAAKEEDGGEHLPEEFPITYAHTPSFVGSHITGYDNIRITSYNVCYTKLLRHYTQLKELDIDGNKIVDLPDSIANLTTLGTLYIEGNPLSEHAKKVIEVLQPEICDIRMKRGITIERVV